jgi:hypothetical protein
MKPNLFDEAVKVWRTAGVDLAIQLEAPVVIPSANSESQTALAYLPDFGSSNGVIVDGGHAPAFKGNRIVKDYASERNCFYSIVNLELYKVYDREHFIEMLLDWGYFGQKKPSWL